ncbi:MAG: hypothetical protein WCP19_12295, partial [Chloroflexota bacterium]
RCNRHPVIGRLCRNTNQKRQPGQKLAAADHFPAIKNGPDSLSKGSLGFLKKFFELVSNTQDKYRELFYSKHSEWMPK